MEDFDNLDTFHRGGAHRVGNGPVALVVIEDAVEIASTLSRLAQLGFAERIAFAPADIAVPGGPDGATARVTTNTRHPTAFRDAVNRALEIASEGTWLHYCFNAEYLFFPFCENRSIGEALAFHAEERRSAMLSYVLDLYSDGTTGVDLASAEFDETGYYALARNDPDNHGHPRERQLDFYGGLRWRFEEHVEPARRRIDRIGLFRAAAGLQLMADHTFNVQEYNTYACPWHNNLTSALCSFRAAKALCSNPISRDEIGSFRWTGTVPFLWDSRQLLDLGLMEPGQWV